MPLNERNGNQTKCTILIVENDDDIRAGLRREVEQLGHRITVVSQRDEALLVEESVTCVVQVNGKVRDRLEVPPDITEGDLRALALAAAGVTRTLGG